MVTTLLTYDQDVLIAMADAHRLEMTLLQVRIERLSEILREHGIPFPEDDPRLAVADGEHLRACREVVTAAYSLLEHLDELRAMVGSGMELVGGERWVE